MGLRVKRGIHVLLALLLCASCDSMRRLTPSYYGDSIVRLEVEEEIEEEYTAQIIDVVLDTGDSGEASFAVRLPAKIPDEGLPCLILLSGLETGKDSLALLPHSEDYAVIAYAYPERLRKIGGAKELLHLYSLRKHFLSIPGQALSIAKWVKKQPWASSTPVNFVGVSMGAMVLPATLRLAQNEGIEYGASVFAYGGSGAYGLLYANVPGFWLIRVPVAAMLAILLEPLEPSAHLPHLRGDFLVVEGTEDELIPERSRDQLKNLLPDPKDVIEIDSAHVDPSNVELIHKVYGMTENWLRERQDDNTNRPTTDLQ